MMPFPWDVQRPLALAESACAPRRRLTAPFVPAGPPHRWNFAETGAWLGRPVRPKPCLVKRLMRPAWTARAPGRPGSSWEPGW